MERVDVTILGRDYSLACSAEEKPVLMAAVRHVDQLMLRIQGSGKVSSNERIAVMAALQVAGELLAMKAPDGPLGGLAVGDFKRRTEERRVVLDGALGGRARLPPRHRGNPRAVSEFMQYSWFVPAVLVTWPYIL